MPQSWIRKGSLALLLFLMILTSCLPEQEELSYDSNARLRFSADMVVFDTIFTSVGSVTKRFRVYNDARNAVKISDISLYGGSSSSYQVAVNGEVGDRFSDVTLLGNDSMLVLVEVFIDPADQNLPFLVSDSLLFNTNGNRQHVDLVAYGQDAVFIDGEVLDCNAVWTADKPYVIYNSILVDTLCTLTIEPGTRIYSHINSYIFAKGSIRAAGTTENPVLFRNDRLEDDYENAPGQWGGIVFLPGSNDNLLENTRIRNAKTGIYLGTPDEDEEPDLVLANTVIENIGGAEGVPAGDFTVQPGFGLLAITSDVYAFNTLINNCEVSTLGNFAGGTYRYDHCTFASYSFDFFRQNASVILANNVILSDESVITAPMDVVVNNSIIWGSLLDELIISEDPASPFTLEVSHSVLRSSEYSDLLNVNNNILNLDPEFTNPEESDYHLEIISPAMDLGSAVGISEDLDGNARDASPDAGCYEVVE